MTISQIGNLFWIMSFLNLILLLGCGEKHAGKVTPETMIDELSRSALRNESWETLSTCGVNIVDAIFAESNSVERARLVMKLRSAMWTLTEPRSEEDRRRRVWALQDINLRMIGYWCDLGRPEEAVEDVMFVLGKYKGELLRIGQVNQGRTVSLHACDPESLRHMKYGRLKNDLNSAAQLFENHVLSKVVHKISTEDWRHVEARFTEIVGRPPKLRIH